MGQFSAVTGWRYMLTSAFVWVRASCLGEFVDYVAIVELQLTTSFDRNHTYAHQDDQEDLGPFERPLEVAIKLSQVSRLQP